MVARKKNKPPRLTWNLKMRKSFAANQVFVARLFSDNPEKLTCKEVADLRFNSAALREVARRFRVDNRLGEEFSVETLLPKLRAAAASFPGGQNSTKKWNPAKREFYRGVFAANDVY